MTKKCEPIDPSLPSIRDRQESVTLGWQPDLAQQQPSALFEQCLGSSASEFFGIRTRSLKRDDDALLAVRSKDGGIDRQNCILSPSLSTIQIPSPHSEGEIAATLERCQHGAFS